MQNLGKHILTFTLAGIFLLSFTGIRMIMHHCMACDATEIHLFAENSDCCSQHHEHHAACHINVQSYCCPTEGDDTAHCDNCCKEEVFYLKNDYETKHDRQIVKLQPALIGVLTQLFFNIEPASDFYQISLYSEKDNSPPEFLTGKDFIIYTRHLKVS